MSADQVIPAIALVGSPNCGKTTLFNWLTGSKFKTVNYAGSTVDCFRGRTLSVYGEPVTVVDTPGMYSLQPHGRDEEVTLDILKSGEINAVIVVIDGTQLNRQLYLVRQIQELGLPMTLAVTMMDIVKKSGRRVDLMKLSELIDAPVFAIDGRLGGGVGDLVNEARTLLQHPRAGRIRAIDWDHSRIEKEVAVAESWARAVMSENSAQNSLDNLRRWDKYLLHPVFGIFFFLLIMGTLFSSIFWLAAPMMDGVDYVFSYFAAQALVILGDGPLGSFVANGIISGVGAVLVFVPQIFILFTGLNLLEDTGYLARAATVVDRPLHKIGLSGRAFVPILSGFACAVPAVMASRNIRSWRERWITVFIIPFMTCSARLPIYVLLLTFLFRGADAWKAGVAMTAFYLGGAMLGVFSAAILNLFLKVDHESHFLMELPLYRWPKAGFTLRLSARRTYSYVKKAGPTIFVFILLLWLGTNLPFRPGASAAEQLSGSYIGRVGQMAEPVFEPMGLDWRAGLGMMSAFVAREVFVSSLAVIFSIADTEQDTLQKSLLEKMRTAQKTNGEPLFTVASVSGLIIYFMIALQCLSTTGVTWREMGSWKFAFAQLVVMNVAAYMAAVAVVHGLRAVGFA